MTEKNPAKNESIWKLYAWRGAVAFGGAIAVSAFSIILPTAEKTPELNTDFPAHSRKIESVAQCENTFVTHGETPDSFKFVVQASVHGSSSITAAEIIFWGEPGETTKIPIQHPLKDGDYRISVDHKLKNADEVFVAQGRITLNDGDILTCPSSAGRYAEKI